MKRFLLHPLIIIVHLSRYLLLGNKPIKPLTYGKVRKHYVRSGF